MESALPPQLHDLLVQAFEEWLPFNTVLGIEVEELAPDRAQLAVENRPELIGNPVKRTLHGGVISATLDAAGGMVAIAGVLARSRIEDADVARVFDRLGTIDLRVDYLRPGKGERFTAVAYPMRVGGTVAVTRMEFHEEDTGRLIAVATGTYIVG